MIKLSLQLSADVALILNLSFGTIQLSLQLSNAALLSLLVISNDDPGLIQIKLLALQLPVQFLPLTCLFSQVLLQLLVCLIVFCQVVAALQIIVTAV